jgi:superfamily I DNA and/or RNA helicase
LNNILLDTSHTSIGIITPYRKQLKKITEQLATLFPGVLFEVNTVDGFQGREMDIIIFSAVRANWKYVPLPRMFALTFAFSNELGFVRDYHRLNVAITRARYLNIFNNFYINFILISNVFSMDCGTLRDTKQ